MRLRPASADEAWWLVGLLAVALALLALWVLAGEVVDGDTLAFDRHLLLLLRVPGDPARPIGPAWLQEVARDVTSLGSVSILAAMTLAVACYLALTARRGAAGLVAVSVGGGSVLASLGKLLVQRPRPDLVPHAMEVYTASFPSAHAMLSAVTYLTLGALLMRVHRGRAVKLYVLGVAVAGTLMVGVSRVYLGVHWPTDVLAGWCGGVAWALLCWLVAVRLQARGQVEPPLPDPPVTPPAG